METPGGGGGLGSNRYSHTLTHTHTHTHLSIKPIGALTFVDTHSSSCAARRCLSLGPPLPPSRRRRRRRRSMYEQLRLATLLAKVPFGYTEPGEVRKYLGFLHLTMSRRPPCPHYTTYLTRFTTHPSHLRLMRESSFSSSSSSSFSSYLSYPIHTPTPPLAFSSHPVSSHHCLSCHRTPPPPRLPTHPNFPSHRRRTSQSSCRNLAFSSLSDLVEPCLARSLPLIRLPSLPSTKYRDYDIYLPGLAAPCLALGSKVAK